MFSFSVRAQLRGAIPIASILKLDADPPRTLKNHFGINLHTRNRVYELYALNESDYVMWLSHLDSLLKKT